MKLPIIQSLWIGSSLSNLEKLCIQSFLDHGHEFHLYTYGEVVGIPDGCKVLDSNEIVSVAKMKQYGKRFSQFSSYFRYVLLYKLGGWWVDMDTICIKPFDFTDEIIFGETSNGQVVNSVIRFPLGHELCKLMQYGCENHTRPMPFDDAVYARRRKIKRIKFMVSRNQRYRFFSSPHLDKAVNYFNLRKYRKPFMVFCSFWHDYGNVSYLRIYDETFADGLHLYPQTYSIDISTGDLTKLGMDKNAIYPYNSLIEQLKRKHKIK